MKWPKSEEKIQTGKGVLEKLGGPSAGLLTLFSAKFYEKTFLSNLQMKWQKPEDKIEIGGALRS